MPKIIKITILIAVISFFTACSNKEENVLQSELEIANECKNMNINFEMDCYDLISYKNSFAQLRLGIYAQDRGLVREAFSRYTDAKKAGNPYANALLYEFYSNGIVVKKDKQKARNLLEEVQDVDPIAAYKLSSFLLQENIQKAIQLLEYASKNGVKDALKTLATIFSNNLYIKEDLAKSEYYNELYKITQGNFSKKIYGR